METVRKAFVDRRLALGMTQQAVATAAAVTRKTISDFENARSSITLATLERLLSVVGLELATRESSALPTLDELASRYPDEGEQAPRRRARGR